jgi:hypothetical protein
MKTIKNFPKEGKQEKDNTCLVDNFEGIPCYHSKGLNKIMYSKSHLTLVQYRTIKQCDVWVVCGYFQSNSMAQRHIKFSMTIIK